jgi:hypothetical protein
MSERSKTNIQFNGHDYASCDEKPVSIRVAEAPALHSGARLAAKLKAKIIVNDTEFNHAGEMSVDDRHHYHEALEALFPPGIEVSISEATNLRQNKLFLILVIVGTFTKNCLSLPRRLLRLRR